MVNGARMEGEFPAPVRKTIQSIKEIVGNHSDNDIYVALKEANMDPNETTQKLLRLDTFHEVRRKRDRKKESNGDQGFVDSRKRSENVSQGMNFRTYPDRGYRRGGYTRDALPDAGVNKEFRVVKDNRANQNANMDMKPAFSQSLTSANEQVPVNVTEKSSTGTKSIQRPRSSSRTFNAPSSSQPRHALDANSSGIDRKELSERKHTFNPNAVSRSRPVKPNDTQEHSATQLSSNTVVGVYSSSTDPVHVPSPDSKSSGSVGAIKREVGVVGVSHQPSENACKTSCSLSSSLVGRDTSSESFQHFPAVSRVDQLSHTGAAEFVTSGISGSRSFGSNQYGSWQHQYVLGHQKANHRKEWKPKSSQKSIVNNPGVIGTPKKSPSPPADDSKDMDSGTTKLQDKFSQVNISENENVIIAQHIQVPENDRHVLTFGSFGMEFDSSGNFELGFQATDVAEDSDGGSTASLSVSAPDNSSDSSASGKPVDILDNQLRDSGSDSPPSSTGYANQLPDKKDTSCPPNSDRYADIGMVHSGSDSPPSSTASANQLPDKEDTSCLPNSDRYADIGMVQDNNSSYAPSSQQQQGPPELPSFEAYDSQNGYDFPYFRTSVDETARGQGLPSPNEAFGMHTANIPTSTIPMVQQQQQQPVPHMYSQVPMPHFTNLMPYRQFISPVYLPQMAMPGYSSNHAYPHPSNGSSYVLMPGGGSHLNANGLKYGIQQFKPVAAGSPTGFGNFTSPSGYAINAPGLAGNATSLEDSTQMKYKDGNMYVQNQQGDMSDLWIQNPRELPGYQSAPYYNMPQTPHGYMPSHAGHTSFNAAAAGAAQSSHMQQFSGLYHAPPQPAPMGNPHHLGLAAMGANVGVGVAQPAAPAGAQVGAYQQPHLGHHNWTANF